VSKVRIARLDSGGWAAPWLTGHEAQVDRQRRKGAGDVQRGLVVHQEDVRPAPVDVRQRLHCHPRAGDAPVQRRPVAPGQHQRHVAIPGEQYIRPASVI